LSEPQTDSSQVDPGRKAGSASEDQATASRRRLAVAKIMMDYCEDAVVNDPLFGKPLVGRPTIAVHKTAEMLALTDVKMDVTDRWTMGSDLTATWEVTGIHSGPYYNLPATGKRIKITGATVVTRRDGRIAVETLYYDADEMLRQLKGEALEELDLPEPEELAAQGEAEFGDQAESEPAQSE
jgi:steroid delta-isomerase-like uncharacterized protein